MWPDRAAPMTDDIYAAAVSLAKEADARRPEFERARRVPPDLFRRAADAGLFRQLICPELGGPGRSAVEWFRVGVERSQGPNSEARSPSRPPDSRS
jgi:alkylation response protein AidB-like acyl-CoA dehydrogenase